MPSDSYPWIYPPRVYPWEDLRFPVSGINPAGAANAPTVDDNLAGFAGTFLFSGSQDNAIAGIAQMPHSWKEGSAIIPHIHWARTATATENITWEFYYRRSNPSAIHAYEALKGPITVTSASGTQDIPVITSFGEIDMVGFLISTLICWQLRRRGDDGSANTARLFELDIHYQIDAAGSAAEVTK